MICNLPRSVLNALERMWILDHSLDFFLPRITMPRLRAFSLDFAILPQLELMPFEV